MAQNNPNGSHNNDRDLIILPDGTFTHPARDVLGSPAGDVEQYVQAEVTNPMSPSAKSDRWWLVATDKEDEVIANMLLCGVRVAPPNHNSVFSDVYSIKTAPLDIYSATVALRLRLTNRLEVYVPRYGALVGRTYCIPVPYSSEVFIL